jgi:ATP/maltotriose-dependent transcriptional regulator MalT
MTQRGERPAQPIATGVSRAAGLLRRYDLLATLDRAATRKVTVISAPPGSGKDDVASHVGDEDAAEAQDAHRVDHPGHRGQPEKDER